MFCSKILVAYDGSDLAEKSLDKALEIAKSDDRISIEVIHVVKIYTHIAMDNFQVFEDALYQEGKDILDKAEASLAKLPNHFHTHLLVGAPATLILNHAKEYNCDLIIMGSRGLSGVKEFLGSVSHMVVQRSPIPVLVVK